MMPPKRTLFKASLYNATSLNTCGDDFIIAVQRFAPDILAINESWLREGCEALAPVVPSYKFKMHPRSRDIRGGRGGGLAYYLRDGLKTRMLQHPVSSVEQWWLRCTVNGLRLAIGTAYRPPWQSVDLFLDALTESITSFYNFDKIILLGDFNINQMETHSVSFHKFSCFLQSVSLCQVVNVPTHYTESSATIIDVVCTDAFVRELEVYNVTGITGHSMVNVTFNIKKQKFMPRLVTYRPIKTIPLDCFNREVLSCDWVSAAVSRLSVSDMVHDFTQNVTGIFDKFAPLKTSYIKDKPLPWITGCISLMMRLRDAALKRYRSTKEEAHKLYYKSLKKQVDLSMYHEKKAFFCHHVNNVCKDPKALWKNIKENVLSESNKTYQLPPHFDNPDQINDHFLTLPCTADVPLSELNYFEFHRFGSAVFTLRCVDEVAVGKAILSINSNAQGIDGISKDMIILTLPHTLSYITALLNKSIATSTFPLSWKTAVVTPIPKIGSPASFSDLRPISLLPFLSKILERVVYIQLVNFLEVNNVFPEFQSGFRKGVSTATALLDVIDNVLAAQDTGKATILTLLDYSRAFDCISIPLLLSKLAYYGFDETTLHWFNSYLSGRSQVVRIRLPDGKTASSEVRAVNRGVPQGSILGPILFILYTADMVKHIQHSRYHMYADDTQIYVHVDPNDIKTALKNLHSDLDNIARWSIRNALHLNPIKSKYMILGSKKQIGTVLSLGPHVSILGSEVAYVTQARNLGIEMDSRLRFEDHVTSVAKNCLFRLKVLYKVRRFLSENVRLNLCESLVLSRLNYGDVVTGPCLLSTSKRLIQRVQNACIRFCFNIPSRSHITPYLHSKKLLNMHSRRSLHFSALVHSVIKAKRPEYLYKKLEWATYTYNSRRTNSISLITPFHTTRAFEGSFRFQASKCWNDLPPPLRKPLSKQNIKQKLKLILLEKQMLA